MFLLLQQDFARTKCVIRSVVFAAHLKLTHKCLESERGKW